MARNWHVWVVRARNSRYTGKVPHAAIPGAYHYFDKEGQAKEFLPGVENDSVPGGFGATVEYQAEAATDAHRRIEAFLAKHLEP